MNNLRLLYDNAVDRATLTASDALATLPATNLLIDRKGEVWRTAGTTATLTLTWAAAETITMVALPFCNFSASATLRVRGYTLAGDALPAFDTGAQLCCRGAVQPGDWGNAAAGVNAFAYGGGAYAVRYFAGGSVQKLVIDLDDSAGNAMGYLEAARLVAGQYWSPVFNADYGARLAYGDTSKNSRNDNGDLVTQRGSRFKKLSFSIAMMPEADRHKLWTLLRFNGMVRPVFCSLFPEHAVPEREEAFQIYGKLPQLNALLHDMYERFSATVDLEEI